MDLLSVVIINYNTFELTSKCIKSIYHYTKVPFEIIVVDNASPDGSGDLIKANFPDIVLLKSSVNLGFAKGNNLGISACSGDTILLLNSDAELVEDTLSYCYRLVNTVERRSVISCQLIFPDGRIQHQCSRFPGIVLNLIEMLRLHKFISKRKQAQLFLSSYFDHLEVCQPDWLWGTFFMFKKDVLKLLPDNKLDETFFMYGEDMKWCYDFKKVGIGCFYTPASKVVHHVGMSSSSAFKTRNIVANELVFMGLTRGQFYKYMYAVVRILNLLSASPQEAKRYAAALWQQRFGVKYSKSEKV